MLWNLERQSWSRPLPSPCNASYATEIFLFWLIRWQRTLAAVRPLPFSKVETTICAGTRSTVPKIPIRMMTAHTPSFPPRRANKHNGSTNGHRTPIVGTATTSNPASQTLCGVPSPSIPNPVSGHQPVRSGRSASRNRPASRPTGQTLSSLTTPC